MINAITPFVLSLEPFEGPSPIRAGFLSSDPEEARLVAEEKYRAGDYRTVALMLDGSVYDVFDGSWASEQTWNEDVEYVTTEESVR